MESRLPKPKIFLQKAVSTIDINTESQKEKATNNLNCLPQSTSTMSLLGNKVVENPQRIVTKSKENKPPKSTLVRAKTISTITRSNITAKATKRPAAAVAVSTVQAKRPNIKTTQGPVGPQRTGKNTLAALNSNNKPVQSITDKSAKPSRWDFKGRLQHKSEELSTVREKYKDITIKYRELEELVGTMKDSEHLYKIKAEKLEILNGNLSEEVKVLKGERSKFVEEEQMLKNNLKESEESLKSTLTSLKDYKEKYASQEVLLADQNIKIQDLQTNLEYHKRECESLTIVKEELQSLAHKMDIDRRVLHNTIQEMKGNIRVFCRVRPRTVKETTKLMCAMSFTDECTIEVGKADGSDLLSCSGKTREVKHEFSFDKVFPPNASQADIFEELSLLVQSALEGYNVCVFAYGQTGSGKTYTMEGEPGIDTEGMIPRTVRHIFKEMKQFELLGWKYEIKASFLEIYNEHIIDLLDSQQKTLDIRMVDSKGQDLYVTNLHIEEIDSPEKLHDCLAIAQQNRAVAATQANDRSSRSHSVARIQLIGRHLRKREMSIGNLNLVDLAGSERLKADEVARTIETKNINKSLANLGNVILALLKKQEHVPYRNSKLTHLLMPSLGGNSKTLMLLNVSPLADCYSETLNSLRFASSVNNCKTGNIKRTRAVLSNTSL